MKGKSLIAGNRETAFRLYCEQGGNVEATLRELAKAGLTLSRPSFSDWRERYNFETRRLAIDVERQKAADCQLSFEENLINDLMERRDAYKQYFKENPTDHQAQYAYAGIIKTLFDIKTKAQKIGKVLDKAEKNAAKMTKEELIKSIREDVYGIT